MASNARPHRAVSLLLTVTVKAHIPAWVGQFSDKQKHNSIVSVVLMDFRTLSVLDGARAALMRSISSGESMNLRAWTAHTSRLAVCEQNRGGSLPLEEKLAEFMFLYMCKSPNYRKHFRLSPFTSPGLPAAFDGGLTSTSDLTAEKKMGGAAGRLLRERYQPLWGNC